MSVQVALHHRTRYRYDRPVALSPQEIRLRPAPHCRTSILGYSLNVTPEKHFVNWQQDPFGNHIARFVFPGKTTEFTITVDLIADMAVINPFDFFLESHAERFPFAYRADLARDLAPFLALDEHGPLLMRWIEDRRKGFREGDTINFLVDTNRRLRQDIGYLVRVEPGVQTCEQTLAAGSGSCRDSAWLLTQILRHFGLAARFVSGYLVQLAPDIRPLDGPLGPERDFTDLHAWTEAYIPGAGWIGLDPTSGLLAGEGHIPLACTPSPAGAAPVTGAVDPSEPQFSIEMSVARIHEDPRVTRPYTESQWQAIDDLAHAVDAEFKAGDVRLTQGGEPTFVAGDESNSPEWNTAALSPGKWKLAEQLAWRLRDRFAPGGLVFYGQGKWYPGEPLPRWALGVFWRLDGKPVWRDPALIARESTPDHATPADARRLAQRIAEALGFDRGYPIEAYEDPLPLLQAEGRLPVNVDPARTPLRTDTERARLARMLERGLEKPRGVVLPLCARQPGGQSAAETTWESTPWPLRRGRLFLLPGDAPMGDRLPLASLPELLPEEMEPGFARDPFDERGDLHDAHTVAEKKRHARVKPGHTTPREVVRTALCVEVRDGRLHVFIPPLQRAEDFLDLAAVVERATEELGVRVRLEGYAPPFDPRLRVLNVTPDPGVIEVNIHPASSWEELTQNTFALYEEARTNRLVAEKFTLDGRHTGTGGGNHVTLGGPTPADSPLLRRPDLLRSLITYWQNHPALSYLFSGTFIGPTSQAPRVDEARDDALYELEIAFQQMALRQKAGAESLTPWLVDRLLRNLLVDLTGNTHRAEFCIDKLYSPDGPAGRLGLLEFRAFEMPPHPRMSLVQMLLLRALVARFWKTPYEGGLIRWGTQLHDRFMLPHFVEADINDVGRDLRRAGHAFDSSWFAPFIEFRFPRYGTVVYENIRVELRQALEPWHVLGEEMSSGGTARYVDSSVERLQVHVNGLTAARYVIACNGRALPLHPTGIPGEFVAGVRFRARNPPSALHPTIGVHAPLVFDIVDTWSGRSIGGCTYHVSHPGGRDYDAVPVNAGEAEARRTARFWDHGHTPGPMTVQPELMNPSFPLTLDLRWSPEQQIQ
ncbi:MAG: transglutaminase family protein [Betaproteobacteria bacterium]|nr:transglutaminase family protein [Betaproteobacteria bacterium]